MDPKQDQLIYALLNSKTKAEASRMSGISHATMYRMLADPQFMAAYRATLRDGFHDALALLAKNVVKAVQTRVNEMGPERTESFSVIAAATRVLDRAFKRRRLERSASGSAAAAVRAVERFRHQDPGACSRHAVTSSTPLGASVDVTSM